jgi:hypothetical protein
VASKILVRNDATPITWKASGGTYALTLTSLANNAAREGVKGDLGAVHAARYAARLELELAVAAVTGTIVELWWSSSTSATAATDNTGISITGADAAWAPAAGVDDCKLQLQFVGALICSDSASGTRFRQEFIFFPPMRYGVPVVVNKAGQALSATAANSFLTLVPLEDEVQ